MVLSDASRAARHTADALKDIVWIINPENDKIEDITLRMKDSAAKLLVGVDYTFECQAGGLSSVLDMEFRRHLLLIYKDILNNIAKHARATRVVIRVGQANGFLSMEARDNGVGFVECDIQRGNGLSNLRKRAAEMGGTIDIASCAGRGTTVTLRAPFNS